MASVFESLSSVNVNEHTEEKGGLTYLSWAWAIEETFKRYPDATYEILRFENNLPYVFDKETGYMVFTRVTINGLTKEMWLPVMDGNNKAMLDHPYEYATKYGKKTVEKATMFDINKTIMRCLTKNLAMFGLGLYIFAGEDLPTVDDNETPNKEETKKKKEPANQEPKKVEKNEPVNQSITEEQLKLLSGLGDLVIKTICGKEKVTNLKELTVISASKWIKYCQGKGMIKDGQ